MKITPRIICLLAGGLIATKSALAVVPDASDHDNIDWISYTGYGSCQMCHDGDGAVSFDAHAVDILNSLHWTWDMTDSATGEPVGKYNVINNYCVAVASNEPRCTSCHIGIGWNQSVNITEGTQAAQMAKIDCLVCHDGSKTYVKNPTGAGAPYPTKYGITDGDPLSYTEIVRSFQTPDRDNCGACHFFGGGGEGVKHGTMDGSLSTPAEATDVHMGNGMNCVDCHSYGAANQVAFVGSRYSKDTHDAQMCIDCHTDGNSGAPNPATAHSALAPKHFSILACQTCHVPSMARGGKATKTYWDWETAGNYIPGDGTKIDRVIKNGDGDIVYHSKKGSFVWGYDIVPEYQWANGNVDHIQVADTIDPNGRNHINVLQSTVEKPGLIFPVKVFVGRQPYDTLNNNLVVPHLFPTPAEKADPATSKAYWQKYNWELAAEAGMAAYGSSYDSAASDIGFAETDFTWVANHMVAPKEEVVQCWECHQSKDRLDMQALGLTGTMALIQSDDRNVTYAGYRIDANSIVDTGAWMGYLEVSNAPWVYSFNLGKYVYLPEEGSGLFGSWTFLSK